MMEFKIPSTTTQWRLFLHKSCLWVSCSMRFPPYNYVPRNTATMQLKVYQIGAAQGVLVLRGMVSLDCPSDGNPPDLCCGPGHLQSPSMPRNASTLAGCMSLTTYKILEPAVSKATLWGIAEEGESGSEARHSLEPQKNMHSQMTDITITGGTMIMIIVL